MKLPVFTRLMLIALCIVLVCPLFACDRSGNDSLETSGPLTSNTEVITSNTEVIETTESEKMTSVTITTESEMTTEATDSPSDSSSSSEPVVTETDEPTGKDTETSSETDSVTELDQSSETTETESTESDTTDTEEETAPPVFPTMQKSALNGDGSTVSFGADISEQDFLSALSYFKSEGFSVYSRDTIGISDRATFVKGDEYYTLVYNPIYCELTMVHAESGANALPRQWTENDSYEKICETSITQHYSNQINGMGYIFRLEDGSFIVYDGGYESDAKDLLMTLTSLKLTDEIHVRAWILTHDHSDHRDAFQYIAESTYAKRIKLDYVMYAPTTDEQANAAKYYPSSLADNVAKFKGAVLLPVHAGMTFDILNVKLEILQTPEMLSIHGKISDFNDTSIISRVVSKDGSAIMLADACGRSADWLVKNVGYGLKSDFVQVAHHGVETGSIPLYDAISASIAFWPCDRTLFANKRGEKIKQHLIESEYTIEHILHDFGTVTRHLSYRPEKSETVSIMPTDNSLLSADPNGYAANVRLEDGILRYDVVNSTDPYVILNVENANIGSCNVIKMVVDAEDAVGGFVFLKTKNDTAFSATKSVTIGNQGTSADGKTTYLIYIGDIAGFADGLKALRIDFGKEAGQTVDIFSIEMFYLDLTAK